MNDLAILATKLNLPLWELEVALKLPISNDIEVTTLSEAESMYRKTEQFGSNAKAVVKHHWRTLCEEALEQATTIEEIRRIHSIAPSDEVLRGKILLKHLHLADSIEEIWAIIGQSSNNIRVGFEADDKLKELTRRAFTSATTLSEARAAFRSAPRDRHMKIAALHCCLEFATTPAEAKRVCLDTNATCECRELALRHWLKLATTTEELLEVHVRCFDHVDIRNETLLKLLHLHEVVPA
jgi:hypothetical protein